MSAVTEQKVRIRYVYDFEELDRVPEGPSSAKISPRRLLSGDTLATGKSTSVGAVVTGDRIHVALVHKPRGTGSKLHTHPNEQFNYVMQGTLIADIDGQVVRVPAGHVIHIPAGMVHSHVSSPEEDVIFVAVKDTRHGIVGPAVDGEHNGPRHLPGFGSEKNVWEVGADGLPRPESLNVTGKKVRYVYPIDGLEQAPEGLCSARVTPKGFVSRKSSSHGAALTGETLHVGLIHKARGSGSKLHTHPNEQFNLVIQGKLVGEIDGQSVEVPAGSVIHMPAGVQHSLMASGEGDVIFLVAKDTRHGLYGPPVDGVEDGPRFLPGFGPKK